MRRNGGSTIRRFRKKGGTLKSLHTFPFTVGRYQALEPRFDKSLGKTVYPVKYGSKTKLYYTAEKQALFMQRRQADLDAQMKKDKRLYDHFDDVKKEKAKKAASRKKKKNPDTDVHDKRLMEYLRNGGFDDLFEDDYDVVPNPRRRR